MRTFRLRPVGLFFVFGFAALARGAAALPGDVNLDGEVTNADTTLLVSHLNGVSPLAGEALANADVNVDGAIDAADLLATVKSYADPPRLVSSSPRPGEPDVAVTRETILTFDKPLDPASLDPTAAFARFGGEVLPARQHLSPDGKSLTLFYQDPLPGSARVRVTVNGQKLRGANGVPVDADLDGPEGGVGVFDFDTLSLTSIPNTTVVGRVFASELTLLGGSWVDVPLEGVTLTVDGMDPPVSSVTDALGNYRLENCPAGKFFVHIDGRTVTTAIVDGVTTATQFPAGPYFPTVGKPFAARAGVENQMMDLYLPLVPAGALVPVSETQDTMVGFPQSVLDDFPSFAGAHLMIPADSLYADDGTRGGMVGIAPVDPERIPGGLPEDLAFPIVLSVQTDGSTNFDNPVGVCFPNLPDPNTGQPLAPGAKSALWSFNHDTGEFEIAGSMTVSPDGTLVCSDPGVGIPAPGWHGTQPGTEGEGGDADEECEAGSKPAESGSAISAPRQRAFGPITVFRSSLTPAQVNFSVPADSDGLVTWFAQEGTPQAGSGFSFQTAFCTPGVKTINAILTESCGATPETISTTVEITIDELGPPLEFVEVGSPTTGSPYQPGRQIKFVTNFAGSFASSAPPMNGTISWSAPGATPASFSPSPSGFGSRGQEFTTSFCSPGTYVVTAQFTDFCGQISTMSLNVEIQGSAACEAPVYGGPFSTVPVGELVRIGPSSTFGFDPGERIRFLAPDGDPAMASFMGTFPDGVPPAFQTAYITPGPKTITVEFTNICGTVCNQAINFNVGAFRPGIAAEAPGAGESPSADRFPALAAADPAECALIEASGRNIGLIELEERMRLLVPLARQRAKGPVFFAAENQSNNFITRGAGGAEGLVHALALRLPANTLYRETILHGPTLKIAEVTYTTPENGATFEFPRFALEPDTSPDTDSDGLHDTGEFVMGTNPNDPDSDDDGVKDGPEVQQGLNPNDGLPVPVGIIASADTPGDALDICAVDNLAVIADGEAGVTVFNIFNGLNPVRLAQVDTPGVAGAVACQNDLIAVADGVEGVAVIDISDPPAARIIRQIAFPGDEALSVAAGAGIAYVGFNSGTIAALELATGLEIARLMLGSAAEDLALSGDFLYAHEASFNGRVSAIPLNGAFEVTGSATPASFGGGNSNSRQRIFAGGGIAYSSDLSGFNTFSLADPRTPAAIAGDSTSQFGWKQIVLNGSGLGIAAVGAGPSPQPEFDHIDIYDTSDPAVTTAFLAQIQTPGVARAVSIFNGIAYVADGEAGMHAANYLAYDTGAAPPTIQLVTNFAPGVAEEGQIVTVTALVDDDVQVRNVEFFLGGELQLTDGGFPFEFRFIAPTIAEQPTVAIGARATDTGGNAAETGDVVLTLVADATPPRIDAVTPVEGSVAAPGAVASVTARFSEPIAPASLNPGSFLLLSAGGDGMIETPDDAPVLGGTVNYNAASRTGSLIFGQPLLSGPYRAFVTGAVTDLAGNPLAGDGDWVFSIRPPQVASVFPGEGTTVPSGSAPTVFAVFDTPMDPATVGGGRLLLFGQGGDGSIGTPDDVLVAGQTSGYEAAARRAAISLPAPLRAGTYRGFISSQVKDIFGDRIPADFIWTFTVEAPRVISANPPDGSLRNVNRIMRLTAAFSTAMDPATLTPASFLLFADGDDDLLGTPDDVPIVPAGVDYDSAAKRAIMYLSAHLPLGMYRASVTAAAANLVGDHLAADFNWSFAIVTGPYDQQLFARPSLRAGLTPGSPVAADFNFDGNQDLAVASGSFDNIRVYLADRDGMFYADVDYPVEIAPGHMLARDFDFDGDLDLAAAKNEFTGGDPSAHVALIKNAGDGTFGPAAIFETGLNPHGLAAGDLDGDSDLDLAVTNLLNSLDNVGSVSILLNDGGGNFTEADEFAVGREPYDVAMADFENDGDLDLAVVNREAGSVSGPGLLYVLLNLGSAQFAPPVLHTLEMFPQEMAVGTLNADPFPDLVVTNQNLNFSSSNFSVLLGNASGTFDSPVSLPSTRDLRGLLLADLNMDGSVDIAAAGEANSSPLNGIVFRLGNGDGTFQPESALLAGSSLRLPEVGELNQKGGPDLAISDLSSQDVALLFGAGDGSFEDAPAATPLIGFSISEPFTADFNDDTHLDVLVLNPFADDSNPANEHVFNFAAGHGDGTFSISAGVSIGANSRFPRDAVVSDFGGDAIPDIATANGIFQGNFQPGSLTVFLNDGAGSFALSTETVVGAGGSVIAIGAGRADADSDADILITAVDSGFPLYFFINNGSGQFAPGPVIALPLAPTDVQMADLNHDNNEDIIGVGGNPVFPSTDNTIVMLSNGDGTFQPPVFYPGGRESCEFRVADFTGDSELDLLIASQEFNITEETARLLRGLGDGTFADAGLFRAALEPQAIAAGDLDGDGRMDAATISDSFPTVAVLLGRGDLDGLNTGQFVRQPLYSPGGFRARGVTLGDYDEDGDLDAAVPVDVFEPINGSAPALSFMENRRIP